MMDELPAQQHRRERFDTPRDSKGGLRQGTFARFLAGKCFRPSV
jgi:hypothetical protein